MPRYYDIDAANSRLEELRPVLEQLRADRAEIAEIRAEVIRLQTTNGDHDHAEEVGRRERTIPAIVKRMEAAVAQIEAWDVTLRQIETGLVDFPALASGRPIWLCWRLGEAAIGWWHETTVGFAGRKPLLELT